MRNPEAMFMVVSPLEARLCEAASAPKRRFSAAPTVEDVAQAKRQGSIRPIAIGGTVRVEIPECPVAQWKSCTAQTLRSGVVKKPQATFLYLVLDMLM